jgi:transcriptional regulator with XRE-family HTH domain
MRTIGDNIRALRYAAGHRHQGDFAKRAGITQQSMSDVESGRVRNPSAETLMRIAAAIPCAVDELLQGVSAAFDASRALVHDPSRSMSTELKTALALAKRIQRLPTSRARQHVHNQVGLLEGLAPETKRSTQAHDAEAPAAAPQATRGQRR